ncbi:ABC transporter permease [Salinimicrobium marinum]|uniref:ABC transporter permease n=1 Tax=Salinimicrobium marinum TaxID=680283 RepID=A0A918VXW3_9FLAO|nr:ABC transporter permease [Salinimicrobium marinum]GHA33870.1 ABC transporter permease [Salinimicrobium marinum]
MNKNYLKIAFRNLWKNLTFTSLNILGLTIAFGVAILLSTYALFQLSYDEFHENKDSIYQVYSTDQLPDGPEGDVSKSIPFAGALQEEVPGVEKITRFNGRGVLVLNGDKQLTMTAAYVDPDFFSIFSFPAIKGEKNNPIGKKSSVAISEAAANKIFGHTDVLGESIRVITEGKESPFTVSAIIEDMPDQSSIKFDLALDFTNQSDFSYADNIGDWDKENHEVYMQLAKGVTPQQFEKSTEAFTVAHYADDMAAAKRDGAQPNAEGNYIQIRLFPVADISLAEFKNGIATANKTMPFLVLGISFLIIFIASVNFINMSIAKSTQRLREIGMRKTLGAGKSQLFFQFWGESILVFIISVALGMLIALALMDPFKTLFNTQATFSSIATPEILTGFIFVLLLITLIAGGYPALLLSKLGTIQALKGKLKLSGKNRVRDFLMVLQFGIAILLISGTFVLHNQLEFMRTKDLGFNKEQVVAFALNGKQNDTRTMQLLRDELEDKPGILQITAANNILGLGKDGSRSTSVLGFEYKGRNVYTNMLFVDYDYSETIGLEVIQGRSFDRKYATDSLSVVINEAMARTIQEENPLNARIYLDDSLSFSVIGVVKDYNFQDLDNTIEPITLFLNPERSTRYAYVKVSPKNATTSFEKIRAAWNKIEPNAEFTGSFLDENIDRTLKRERTMTTIISSGAIIAIVLSCIGLFAISLLIVAQRRKEIGIRKVVGASVSTITLMLTKDFLKLVGISFLIAAPVAWWLMSKWLQEYPYKIELNIWIFIAAGVLSAVIAVLTISFKTIKAALQNPVKSLKTE